MKTNEHYLSNTEFKNDIIATQKELIEEKEEAMEYKI